MGLVKVINITDIADILQIYCRYIEDILRQITADCGRLQWITVKNGRL